MRRRSTILWPEACSLWSLHYRFDAALVTSRSHAIVASSPRGVHGAGAKYLKLVLLSSVFEHQARICQGRPFARTASTTIGAYEREEPVFGRQRNIQLGRSHRRRSAASRPCSHFPAIMDGIALSDFYWRNSWIQCIRLFAATRQHGACLNLRFC